MVDGLPRAADRRCLGPEIARAVRDGACPRFVDSSARLSALATVPEVLTVFGR